MTTLNKDSNRFLLWSTDPADDTAKAFMSALKLSSNRWSWTDNPKEADLWCVQADHDDLDSIIQTYRELGDTNTEVVFLSHQFATMPFPKWTYFKVPVNVGILHKWLKSKNLTQKKQNNNSSYRWLTDKFKLSYWPNITAYGDGGPEIMMLCSGLLRNWASYDDLQQYNVNGRVLSAMLKEASDEGNLVYLDAEDSGYGDLAAQSEAIQEQSMGLFKRLFNRFVN